MDLASPAVSGTSVYANGLNHLSSASSTSLRSGLRYRFILDPLLFKRTNNFGLFFQIVSTVEFTRPNFLQKSDLFFQFSICRIALTFPSTLNTFLLLVTVATLSRYQSPC